MNMRRNSRFLCTSIALVALLALLVTTAVPVLGGDVFQCPDGKGGVVWRDLPCSVSAPDQQPPAQPPSPGVPSHTREKAPASPPQRATAPPVETPEPRSSNCLRVRSVKAHRQSDNQLAVELTWEVAVQNKCKQSVSAVLAFTIYGSKNLTLDTDSTKIVVSADGTGTIHGIMRVSREKIRQMKRYDAKLSVL
jgi:hypothetical protein